jgi:glycine dehydrogenase
LSDKLHPQTISVVETRCSALGMEIVLGNVNSFDYSNRDVSGVLFQYPDTEGNIMDFSEIVHKAHTNGVNLYNL